MTDKIDDGGPAFPVRDRLSEHFGMSLRSWYAGQALVGLVSNNRETNPNVVAELARRLADAMIAELKKGTSDD